MEVPSTSNEQQKRIAYLKRAVAIELANIRWAESRKNAADALTLLSALGIPTELLLPIAKKVGDNKQKKPLQEVH